VQRLGRRGEREVEANTLGDYDLQEDKDTKRAAMEREEEEEAHQGCPLLFLLISLCVLSSPPPLFI
jgi:hypothetical protein